MDKVRRKILDWSGEKNEGRKGMMEREEEEGR